ncbi:MAG: Uma2 family endonuclease [Phycisphaerales bacterium]
MSTAAKYPADFGYAGLTMKADEYLALGETPDRYELVHGVVLMSPSPLPIHSLILSRLQQQLLAFGDRTSSLTFFSDTDVRFDDTTVYRPDLCVYSTRRLPAIPGRLDLAPDLVIEVLSPSHRGLDLMTKRRDYEKFGVGEYWIIDPANGEVRAWRRTGTRFEDVPCSGDQVQSAAIPGLLIDMRPVRALLRGA